MQSNKNSPSGINRYLLPAIILPVVLVYIRVAWHDFVNLDDPVILYSNTYVRSGITNEGIRWAFTSDFASNWVPLSMISHMLDVQLFGVNPSGHHLVNLLYHIATTIVIFLFFNRATRSPYQSTAVALLFALHPMQVESVAWIAERKDVLSAFFWMLTLYAYLIYSEQKTAARYIATLVLFVCSLLAKPMAVTLPVVLLLLDRWPLGRYCPSVSSRGTFWLFLEKIPFVMFSLIVSIITFMLKKSNGEIITDYGLTERIFRACVLYCKYIFKIIFPVNLAVYYPGTEIPPNYGVAFAAVGAIVCSVAVAYRMRERYPYLGVGLLWFLISLLPVIGVIQSGACTFADRYVYLPAIGLAIIFVWGGGEIVEKLECRKMAVMICLALFLCMIFITERQLSHWKNSYSLLSHAIEVTEGNWLALNNLGQVYLNAGKVDEAIWYFNESVKANPRYVIAWVNLGALLSVRNRPVEAFEALQRALQLEPKNQKAQVLMQSLYQ